jgi:aerobic-type carbon monoxide dehydrogenase small subunit (CoxS/CutS family)
MHAQLFEAIGLSKAFVDEYFSGNLCRCGTYQRIRKAIRRVERGDDQ